MKKALKKFNNLSYILLITAFILAIGTVSSWIILSRYITDADFSTGKLDSELEFVYWDRTLNEWAEIPATGMTAQYYPNFGSLSDTLHLPDDCEIYLMLNVDDISGAKYTYDIFMQSISINIYEKGIKLDNLNFDYYLKNTSGNFVQNCLQFFSAVSTESNLSLTQIDALFSGQEIAIEDTRQSLSSGAFVEEGQWLYVKLSLNPVKLINIVREIPSRHMPYSIEFFIEVQSEIWTKD